MNKNLEILQKWCAHKSDVRDFLHAPFKSGTNVYAASSGVCLKTGSIHADDILKLENGEERIIKRIDDLTSVDFKRPFEYLQLPEKKTCQECNGTKTVTVINCLECDNEGTLSVGNFYSDYDVDCASCEEGVNQEESEEICGECEGSGFQSTTISILGSHFNSRYIEKMQELNPTCFEMNNGCLIFKTAVFTGAIMPVRVDC